MWEISSYPASKQDMESPTEPGVKSSAADCIAMVVACACLETVISILQFPSLYKLSATKTAHSQSRKEGCEMHREINKTKSCRGLNRDKLKEACLQ